MRRLVPLLLSAFVALILVAGPALAAAPSRTAPERYEFDLDFPGICAFPLVAHVEGYTHSITFVNSNGDTIRGWTGGQLFVTWIRTDTDASQRFAIPGPTFFAADGSPIRGTGTWANPELDGTWFMTAGIIVLDENFNTVSMVGRKFAVCDLMA
jgi:hypothetical protein